MQKEYQYTIYVEDELDLDAIVDNRHYLVSVNGDRTVLHKGSPLNLLKEQGDYISFCIEYPADIECTFLLTVSIEGQIAGTQLVKGQKPLEYVKETYGDDAVIVSLLRVPNSKAVFR